MSARQIPQVNVKTSGRHICLSACREPARVQASVLQSQVIESIAEEHDTSSHSHSASRRTGTDMLSIPLHRCPAETPACTPETGASSAQKSPPQHAHAPPELRYKVNLRSIRKASDDLLGQAGKLWDGRRAPGGCKLDPGQTHLRSTLVRIYSLS